MAGAILVAVVGVCAGGGAGPGSYAAPGQVPAALAAAPVPAAPVPHDSPAVPVPHDSPATPVPHDSPAAPVPHDSLGQAVPAPVPHDSLGQAVPVPVPHDALGQAVLGQAVPHDSLQTSDLDSLPTRLRLTYERVGLEGEPPLGLVGGHYDLLASATVGLFVGVGGFGAITGDRGGLFVVGLTAGWRLPVPLGLRLELGAFAGGGGGAAAAQGGGLMVRPHLAVELPLGGIALRAEIAHVSFPSGAIAGTTLAAGLTVDDELVLLGPGAGHGRSADAASAGPRTRIGLLAAALTPLPSARRRGGAALEGAIGLAGARLDRYLSEHLSIPLLARGALAGAVAGYMDVLGGVAWYAPVGRTIELTAELLAGGGGGGDVDTAGGLLVQPSVGAVLHLSRGVAAELRLSYLDGMGRFRAMGVSVGIATETRAAVAPGVSGATSSATSTASGATSTASGATSTASGTTSTASGTTSTGASSTACGATSTASSATSTASGTSCGVISDASSSVQPDPWEVTVQGKAYLTGEAPARSGRPMQPVLGLVGAGMARPILPWLAVTGRAFGAFSGGAGGYAEGLVGATLTAPLAPRLDARLALELGAGGGGGVPTGPGFIATAALGLRVAITRSVGVAVSYGRVQAPAGSFVAQSLEATLVWKLARAVVDVPDPS